VIDILGDKLGPLVFRFGHFNNNAFKTAGEFLTRLTTFLKKLPQGRRSAAQQ